MGTRNFIVVVADPQVRSRYLYTLESGEGVKGLTLDVVLEVHQVDV